MTTQQIQDMIHEREAARREARLRLTPNNLRVPHQRPYKVKGNKGNQRAKGWDS